MVDRGPYCWEQDPVWWQWVLVLGLAVVYGVVLALPAQARQLDCAAERWKLLPHPGIPGFFTLSWVKQALEFSTQVAFWTLILLTQGALPVGAQAQGWQRVLKLALYQLLSGCFPGPGPWSSVALAASRTPATAQLYH